MSKKKNQKKVPVLFYVFSEEQKKTVKKNKLIHFPLIAFENFDDAKQYLLAKKHRKYIYCCNSLRKKDYNIVKSESAVGNIRTVSEKNVENPIPANELFLYYKKGRGDIEGFK